MIRIPIPSPLLLALTVALAACACSAPEPAPTLLFEDVSDRVGLTFVHDLGPQLTYFLPEIMGPGSAILDYDGDADLDLYLINGTSSPGQPLSEPQPRNRLLRQESDGSFTDVTDASGLGDPSYGMGAAVADYDNDGHVDVYVTNHGPNELYRNRGDGTFERATDHAGVGDDGWGTSATFLDYDADGFLDLYVANYLLIDREPECTDASGRRDYCDIDNFLGDTDRLYHNRGDGTFDDVSESSGIATEALRGLGVVAVDLTEDRRVDIYVANDNQRNLLWVNQGDGRFRNEAVPRGLAYNEGGTPESGMGLVSADLDGDLDPDIVVTHLTGETHTFYRNDGQSFDDATAVSGLFGLSLRFTGFGIVDADLEHDGDLDLVAANGHVFRSAVEPGADVGRHWVGFAEPGSVYLNEGGSFVDAGESAGALGVVPRVGRGVALGDVDRDGDMDVLVNYIQGRARLYYNVSEKVGRWLIVQAYDETLRRDVLGAQVTVDAGGRRYVRWIQSGGSYLTSSEPVAHFGLGPVDRVDKIEVVWPDGTTERFPGGEADRRVTLTRGTGQQ